jgi:enoyl-CoA hydratase/carnithine racemase
MSYSNMLRAMASACALACAAHGVQAATLHYSGNFTADADAVRRRRRRAAGGRQRQHLWWRQRRIALLALHSARRR